MDRLLLRVAQAQILVQCRFVTMAHHDITDPAGARLWFGIQNLLTAAANISKILWGQGGRFTVEREPLRQSLSVSESSPLKPTTMRNHFEHIDERLDEWNRTSPDHNVVDGILGPVGMIAGIPATDIFRAYDPAIGEVRFWGDTYDIPAIVTEVERVAAIAQAAVHAPPDWGPSP